MPWKCPQCGVTSADDKRACEACGFVEFGSLTLVSAETNKEIKFNIDTTVGRGILRAVAGEEVKFASDPQFILRRDHSLGSWAIERSADAKNPTFYNGTALADTPMKVEDGGVISIGPDKMKLTVRLGH